MAYVPETLLIYLKHGPWADHVAEQVDTVENDADTHGDGQQGRVPPSKVRLDNFFFFLLCYV
jgi:hypothetical protein